MTKINIPIFLISNNDYVPYLLVSMTSIVYNTTSFIKFYIIESDINHFRKQIILNIKKKFKNCEIIFIHSDLKKFDGFFIRPNFTADTYNKFLIPTFDTNIKRAIYLDSDTIVLGDIKELYEQNLDKFMLGAVEEYAEVQWQNKLKDIFDIKGDLKHFNSGVLLIDCERWRENDTTNKLLKIAKDYSKKAVLQDQGCLNKFFHENYKIIDIKFNLTTVWAKEAKLPNEIISKVEEAKSKLVIRHFIYDKPWNTNKYTFIKEKDVHINNFDEFWYFAKMTDFYEGLLCNYIAKQKENTENE